VFALLAWKVQNFEHGSGSIIARQEPIFDLNFTYKIDTSNRITFTPPSPRPLITSPFNLFKGLRSPPLRLPLPQVLQRSVALDLLPDLRLNLDRGCFRVTTLSASK